MSSRSDEPLIQRTVHVKDLKSSVERAAYVVDSRAVAEAMLRRASELRRQRRARGFDAASRPA